MLQGKTKSTIRWLSDHSKGQVLLPTASIEKKSEDGTVIKVPMMEILHQKHPNQTIPPSSTLLKCDPLPLLEDVEITENLIQRTATLIQAR